MNRRSFLHVLALAPIALPMATAMSGPQSTTDIIRKLTIRSTRRYAANRYLSLEAAWRRSELRFNASLKAQLKAGRSA